MTSGYFSTSYSVDRQIFRTVWSRVWMGILFVILLSMPFVLSDHIIYLLNLLGITIISALGLNLLVGFTGQISLAQSAFMGIGAYTAAILGQYGLPSWIVFPSAGLIALVFGVILGFPSLRIKGLYLIMSTMAFEVIMEFIFMKWEALTKGSAGMHIPPIKIGSFVFNTDFSYYYIILTFVVLATLYMTNLVRTKPGRAFIAIRDHDVAAKMIGVNLTKYKLMAFAISSFYAGFAGALFGSFTHYIYPEQFNMMISINYLAIVIIGGMGSITGTIFGAIFMELFPEFLRVIMELSGTLHSLMSTNFFNIKTAFFGIMIIVFLIWEGGGLYALWGKVKIYFRLWPYKY